jgi:general stress protein 26
MAMLDKEAQDHKQLRHLIRNIRFAMFTSRHSNGHLHACPMTTLESYFEGENALWFFMSRASGPVNDIAGDASVNISYADPGKDAYVSVSGNARVVDDQRRKEALWTPAAKAWFPAGATDPDLVLVRVVVVHASYWVVKENRVVRLFEMARAVVTGKPPKDPGEHGKVRRLH